MASIDDLPCEILKEIFDRTLRSSRSYFVNDKDRARQLAVLTTVCRRWHSIVFGLMKYKHRMILGARKYIRPDLVCLATFQDFFKRITQLNLYVHDRQPWLAYHDAELVTEKPGDKVIDCNPNRAIELAKLNEMAKLVIDSNDSWKEYRDHQRWLDERRKDCHAFDHHSEFLLMLLNSSRLETIRIKTYFCDNADVHGERIEELEEFDLSDAINFLPGILWQSGACAQIKCLELIYARVNDIQDVQQFQGMQIRELYLEGCEMPPECLQPLLLCFPPLQRLTITGCTFTDRRISPLSSVELKDQHTQARARLYAALCLCRHSLQHLVLGQKSSKDDSPVGSFSHFENLQTLATYNTWLISKEGPQVSLCSLLPARLVKLTIYQNSHEDKAFTDRARDAGRLLLQEAPLKLPNLKNVRLADESFRKNEQGHFCKVEKPSTQIWLEETSEDEFDW